MVSGKIGSLVYNVIADTKQFKEGMVLVGRELAAAKKMFLETRNPIEQMGLQLDGITRLAKTGSGPVDMYSRSIVSLAASTKGGRRETRAYIADLRAQAQGISNTRLGIGGLSKEQLKLQTTLRNLANETERELRAHVRSEAAKRKNQLATDRLARAELKASKEAKRLAAEQRRAAASMRETAVASKGLGGQLMAIGKHIGFITAGYAALRQVKLAIGDALELERSQVQFQVFTGSVKESKRLIADLRDFAARTPLTFKGSQQAVKTLMQYGVASKDVMKRLKQLGDVSGGSLESLQRLSLAFGQISANTRLQGQELRQLIEAGFNPLQVISEKTGESMSSLRQRMAAGAVSAQEVADALEAATTEGGRFNDMLKTIGEETGFGKIQILKGEVEKLRADIAAGAAEGLGDAAGVATKGIQEFRGAAQSVAESTTEAEQSMLAWGTTGLLAINPLTIGYAAVAVAFNSLATAQRGMIEETKNAKEELEDFDDLMTDQERKDEAFEKSKIGQEMFARLAALREEAKQVQLGAKEYEIAQAKKSGATEQMIKDLRWQLEWLDRLKKGEEERAAAKKKNDDDAKAAAKALKDAANEEKRRKEGLEKAAENLRKALETPLDNFVKEMNQLRLLKMKGLITMEERNSLEAKVEDDFLAASDKDREELERAEATARGGREEFDVIAGIATAKSNAEAKRHAEAQAKREASNAYLNQIGSWLENLPGNIAALIPEPVE